MWVLSVDAGTLLSVVQFDPKKAPVMAQKHGALDPDVKFLLVRARHKPSLEYVVEVLEALYAGEVEGWEKPLIDADSKADYKYRTIITADEWKRYLVYEVDGIDYSSHVKEETVRRQPEPKHKNLYTALSATWSAWSKLQDTPPYGASYWSSKPDCKNCNHKELKHNVAGTQCNEGWIWKGSKQEATDKACQCSKYEPKPAPAKPVPAKPTGAIQSTPAKSAEESAKVFLSAEETDAIYGTNVYESAYPTNGTTRTLPADTEDDFAPVKIGYAEGEEHEEWCPWWDGDMCLCEHTDNCDFMLSGACTCGAWERDEHAGFLNSAEQAASELDGVYQEPAPAGENKAQKKARLRRNKRRRRQARQEASGGQRTSV